MSMSVNKTISVTGLRKHKLKWSSSEYYIKEEAMIELLMDILRPKILNGYNSFLTGMATGVDMIFAKAVIRLKAEYNDLTLQAVLPFKDQENRYADCDKKVYKDILEQCDIVRIIENDYSDNSYKMRNQYLVNNSSILIAVTDNVKKIRSGTTQTINLAKDKIEIIHINNIDFSVNTL